MVDPLCFDKLLDGASSVLGFGGCLRPNLCKGHGALLVQPGTFVALSLVTLAPRWLLNTKVPVSIVALLDVTTLASPWSKRFTNSLGLKRRACCVDESVDKGSIEEMLPGIMFSDKSGTMGASVLLVVFVVLSSMSLCSTRSFFFDPRRGKNDDRRDGDDSGKDRVFVMLTFVVSGSAGVLAARGGSLFPS